MQKKSEPIVVQTDLGAKDGQNKCPKCGATDISLNVNNSKLRCNFCRHEFEPQKISGFEEDITQLEGEVLASGTQDIVNDTENMITLKCSSCGAEVVIDTEETTQARCHWCRNTLSINNQIPNGAVPDVVLPFSLKKEEARNLIEGFVKKRKFFAHPKFRKEFTTDNIMGVYFPYMIVDINAHACFIGKAEEETRSYQIDGTTYYDADLYEVEREFDLTIEGLTVESSSDKLNKKASDKTNNIINSIMPFDTENCVKWDANYLKGYSSEKRDVNIEHVRGLVDAQAKDIARFAANESLTKYDRGVCWNKEHMEVKGKQWKTSYLPVWLYSYQQVKSESNKVLHYVAVNGRTKEVMGSVPIHMPKLLLISGLAEILGAFVSISVEFEEYGICCLSGIVYFAIMYARYRNSNARHFHEKETKKRIFNLRKVDNFIKKLKRLRNSKIDGCNNDRING